MSPARLLAVAVAAFPALALAQGAPPAPAPSPPAAAPPAGGPAATPPAGAATADLKSLLEAVDADWTKRDEPGPLEDMKAKLAEAEKIAPNDYDVLWRESRYYFWLADDPNLPSDQKSKLGKISWEYGDRATAANPNRVEGWNYAAAGMGNYALGIGVFTALRQGIEGKFKDRLFRATKIDPTFEHGAIQTAWGRFWYELPWPKYDAAKSRHALEDALKQNPDNVRAHVYMADLLRKEDHPKDADAQLEAALAKPPGAYDPPEERRWQAVARKGLGRQ